MSTTTVSFLRRPCLSLSCCITAAPAAENVDHHLGVDVVVVVVVAANLVYWFGLALFTLPYCVVCVCMCIYIFICAFECGDVFWSLSLGPLPHTVGPKPDGDHKDNLSQFFLSYIHNIHYPSTSLFFSICNTQTPTHTKPNHHTRLHTKWSESLSH